MISYAAFADEMIKIAEDDRRKPSNKRRLGRALLVGAAGGAGVGAGHFAAKALKEQARKRGWMKAVAKGVPRSALRKYAPMAFGALAGGGGMLLATTRKKSEEHVDKGKRPKQHGPLSRVH